MRPSPVATRQEFWRFVAVGGLNTIGGLATILALQTLLDAHLANAAGYALWTPIAFCAHRSLTFRHGGAKVPAAIRFLTATAVGFLFNWLMLRTALLAGVGPALAQLLASVAHAAAVFALSRWWVFSDRR